MYLCIYLSTYLCICLFGCLAGCLSVCLSVCVRTGCRSVISYTSIMSSLPVVVDLGVCLMACRCPCRMSLFCLDLIFLMRRFGSVFRRFLSVGSPLFRRNVVIIHVASRRQPPAPHRSLLLPLFSSIAVAPRQEPLCGRHGLNDVVLTPSRPLVTANDVGH